VWAERSSNRQHNHHPMSLQKIGCSIYENVCVSAARFYLQRKNKEEAERISSK